MPVRSTLAGLGLGLGIGAALGIAVGAPVLGPAFGLLLGGVIAARPRQCSVPAAASDRGSVARPLLWLLAGFAVLGLVMLAITPELVGAAPGTAGRAALVALAAGVPGLVVILVLAARRRDDEPEE